MVLKATSISGYALAYASEALRNDREVVLTAIGGALSGWDTLKYASISLRNDREVVLKAVSVNWRALEYASAAAAPSALPPRHFCVVSGWIATTKDPDSGLHFANQAAYDQIKDQPPPWVRLSGNAPHHEALRIVMKGRE